MGNQLIRGETMERKLTKEEFCNLTNKWEEIKAMKKEAATASARDDYFATRDNRKGRIQKTGICVR